MSRKLLTCIFLFSIVNLAFSQELIQAPAIDNDMSPNDTLSNDRFGPAFSPFYNCNFTVCSLPCEGAAPPPSCPDKLPYCMSRCACIRYCYTPNIICFETKHCIHHKKQFIKRRRV